jgi:hypothetical protein
MTCKLDSSLESSNKAGTITISFFLWLVNNSFSAIQFMYILSQKLITEIIL